MVLLLAGPPCIVGPSQPGDGETRAVTLDNLLFMPERYDCKSVRTKGTLDVGPSRREPIYTLRGTSGARLVIGTTALVAGAWAERAPHWIGREVEVTGLVSLTRPGTPDEAPPPLTDPDTGGTAIYITIWGFFGPPDDKQAHDATAGPTLDDLTANPGDFEGRTVTVLGQFRGANLFGDLPLAGRHAASDWVIKDGRSAAWVTGKKPKGGAWSLDPMLKSDTSRWLRVTGRVSTLGGVVVIRAASVSLTRSPSPASLLSGEPPH